jgi:hypothetical protein
MKLIRPQKTDGASHPHVFHITQREKDLLLVVLKQYPMLRSNYHRISQDPKTIRSAEQEWLEEAMEQQRVEHKKKLGQFFNNDQRFFKESHGELRLTLTGEQMEWMLRVLNEVRVGSWVRLGRPEPEKIRKTQLTGAQYRYFSAMELSGYFQASLLEAFS